jgi:DNA-binding transcriptional LysR family regulator
MTNRNALMNLRRLRTFVAIADNGGFARAAARLNVTQSAASRQILALETELEVRLFDRIGRRVHLTLEGEDLLVRSRRLLSDAASLSERARALKGGQTGTLRVGATPHVIETLLSEFLIQYRRRYPCASTFTSSRTAVRAWPAAWSGAKFRSPISQRGMSDFKVGFSIQCTC